MIERAAMTWLVNALWLVPLIAATAALCTRFARLGPAARHASWLAALALALSLPALPAAMLHLRLAPLTAAPSVSRTSGATDAPGLTQRAAMASAPPADPLPPMAFDHAWTRAILSLAGVVVAIAMGRLVVAVRAGRGLIRAARPCYLDPALQRIVNRVARQHARPPPRILESEAIAGPAVVGVARPTILVPPGFAYLPWDEQCAALLHEVAHVARRDYGWNLVCEAVSLPLAWHPAILPIKAGIRRSRETACDALAARAMSSPMTYAKCLVSLAGKLGPARPASAVVVGLIGKSDLEARLTTLLNSRPNRLSAFLRTAGAVGMAAAVLAPALVFRVTPAFADETVVARRLLASAGPMAPTEAASPAPVVPAPRVDAKPARKPIAAVGRRVASLRHEAPLAPLPPPPPPPPAPAPPPAPPAPPAAPPPPAPPAPIAEIDIHEHAGHVRYEVIVRRALERALSAEKVTERDEIRRALAELRIRQLERVRADEARIHADVAAAMAEFDRAHVERTLDQLKSRLQSPEFRNSVAAAEHEAARAAAAEARADDVQN